MSYSNYGSPTIMRSIQPERHLVRIILDFNFMSTHNSTIHEGIIKWSTTDYHKNCGNRKPREEWSWNGKHLFYFGYFQDQHRQSGVKITTSDQDVFSRRHVLSEWLLWIRYGSQLVDSLLKSLSSSLVNKRSIPFSLSTCLSFEFDH